MQFFGLLLCTLMALSVLSAPNGRLDSAGQRRSLAHEMKGSWMSHIQRRQASAATGTAQLIGGSITRDDLRNLVKEFLKSSTVPGPAPTSSLVGKTKATEILVRLEAADKPGTVPALTPKTAQIFLRIMKRVEGSLGSSKPARRQSSPPLATLPNASTAPGEKTVKDLLKAFVESLPEVTPAPSAAAPKPTS